MGTLFGFHLAARLRRDDARRQRVGGRSRRARRPARSTTRRARQVRVARHPRDLYGSQMLFLFVKAVDTLRALRAFAGELDPASPVISLQNGVGNEDAIKTALGGAVPVILGITTESSQTVAPGHVRSSEQGNTIIGSTTASSTTVADGHRAADAQRPARLGRLRHPPAPLGKARRQRRGQRALGAARLRRRRDPARSQRRAPRRSAGRRDRQRRRRAEDQSSVRQSLAVRHRGHRAGRRRKELDGLRPGIGTPERDRSHQRRGRRVRAAHRHADAV